MHTGIVRNELATRQMDGLLKDATLAMRRTITVPPEARSRFYDVCRGEPRRMHLMGSYPNVASIFAAGGAPFVDVVAPMSALTGFLWMSFYQPVLPCIVEATTRETNANHALNHAQHRVLRDPHLSVLDEAIEHADVQIAETRLYRAVLMSLRHRRPA